MKMTVSSEIIGDMIDGVKSVGEKNDEGVLRVKDYGVLLMTKGSSNVILFANRIESEAMEEYQVGEFNELGIKFDKLDDAINNKGDDIALEVVEDQFGGHKLSVSQGGYTYTLNIVNPDTIEGNPQDAPNLDYAVEAKGDIGQLQEFATKADSVLGAGSFIIRPNENNLIMYSERDGEYMDKIYSWDEFESYTLDWDKALEIEKTTSQLVDPQKEKAVESVFSVDFFKELNLLSDDGTVFVENEAPIKIVFDTPDGVSASYILTPRIPTDGEVSTVPDEIAKSE